MSFYTNLKDFLIKDLKQKTNFKINIFNDATDDFLARAPLENEINLIIKTDTGTTSKIKDINLTSYPVAITALINQNELQEKVQTLSDYVESVNGQVFNTNGQYFNLALEKPSVLATDILIDSESDQVTAATLFIMGSCLVSDEPIGLPVIEIDLGQGFEVLPAVTAYADVYNVNISTIGENGELLNRASVNDVSREINCDIRKLANNATYKKIIALRSSFSAGLIKLKKDGETLNAIITSIAEQQQGTVGIPSLHLVFRVVR